MMPSRHKGRVEVQIHTFLTLGKINVWTTSRLGHIMPEEETRYALDTSWLEGPGARLDASVKTDCSPKRPETKPLSTN
jgi:hypothetical protein